MATTTAPETHETSEPQNPAPGRHTSGGRVWATFALVIGGLGLLVIIVLGVIGAFILRAGISDNSREVRELAPVPGAPEADLIMVVTPVGETGFDIDQLFSTNGSMDTMDGMAVVTGSPRHVSYVETPFDTMAIYSWQQAEESTNPVNGPAFCLGGIGEYSGFQSCSGEGTKGPNVSASTTEDNRGTSFDVFVDGLPADAEWVVVETRSGMRVAAQVVDGIAFVSWPAGGTGPDAQIDEGATIQALDADFVEVWSAPIL